MISCFCRFEALLLEEQTAVQEMAAFERKLESWAAIPRAQHLKTDKGGGGEGERGPGSLPPSSMPLAVLAFEVETLYKIVHF